MPEKPDQNNAGRTAAGPKNSGANMSSGRALNGSRKQFVIAPRRIDGMMFPFVTPQVSLDQIEQALRSSPEIEILDRIGPKGLVSTLPDGMSGVPAALVARMAAESAEILKQQSAGQLIVERDQPLRLLASAVQPEMVTPTTASGAPEFSATITVLGNNSSPVRDAEVFLYGGITHARAVTDDKGQVTLALRGETSESLRGLYVKPKSDFWTFYETEPELDTNQTNVISLRPLSESFTDFPRQEVYGWGQKTMRLDQLPSNFRGQGARVAVIDSGATTTHQDLRSIKFGFDVVNKRSDPGTWNQDVISHGSHCAGIIAGADNGVGIRGFAPDAEVHVCKLFPGGQISQLIEALEYCIEKQIDVVNLSLGGIDPSLALEQQILRARRLGVACIVAAGNTGGAVEYPASSPNVLAVAAIGKLGEFPQDSYHAQTVGLLDGTGYFSPRFTSYGPEIGVCAPGVAIVSSVPPNNYSVWDGTSIAAAHVAGLATLILAHYPEFQGPFRARNSDRVARLFQILKSSARQVNVGDPRRVGFGIPDVLVALGLAPRSYAPFLPWALGMNPFTQPWNSLMFMPRAETAIGAW
jgi:subtilisin family serine protease